MLKGLDGKAFALSSQDSATWPAIEKDVALQSAGILDADTGWHLTPETFAGIHCAGGSSNFLK